MTQPSVIRTVPGTVISVDGKDYQIIEAIDLQKFLCKDCETLERCVVDFRTQSVTLPWKPDPKTKVKALDLFAITPEQLAQAELRRKAIEPLMTARYGDRAAKEAAKDSEWRVSTLYRWYTLYRNSGGLLSSLIDHPRTGGRGKSRVHEDVEAIITTYLNEVYLSPQKPTIAEAADQIGALCKEAKHPAPHLNTIRLRISRMTDAVVVRERRGKDEANNRFAPEKGKIPNANFPLQLTQMDHTPLPIIVVDDVHRMPMGRAYLTALMDVNSRVVLGIYLSLEAPATTNAGICISHALLPKDSWLQSIGMGHHEWPFWGTPDVLHMDNGPEFRGDTLRTVANVYDIDLTFRPVKKPNYGAHIERLMGTLSTKLNSIGGATFSGPEEKGVYDAEQNACLTFDELQRRLVNVISRYHIEKHSAIGMSPREKWKQGIKGETSGSIKRGPPPIRTDVDKVRMDFLPISFRTIQPHGVEIDKIVYQDDVLHEFVGLKQKDSRAGILHPFRRDPRDISEILFFHPSEQRYFTVRSEYEQMSLWEYRLARKKAEDRGQGDDKDAIYGFVMEGRQIDKTAAEKTKTARRNHQRQQHHAKAAKEKPLTANKKQSVQKSVDRNYDADATFAVPDEE